MEQAVGAASLWVWRCPLRGLEPAPHVDLIPAPPPARRARQPPGAAPGAMLGRETWQISRSSLSLAWPAAQHGPGAAPLPPHHLPARPGVVGASDPWLQEGGGFFFRGKTVGSARQFGCQPKLLHPLPIHAPTSTAPTSAVSVPSEQQRNRSVMSASGKVSTQIKCRSFLAHVRPRLSPERST